MQPKKFEVSVHPRQRTFMRLDESGQKPYVLSNEGRRVLDIFHQFPSPTDSHILRALVMPQHTPKVLATVQYDKVTAELQKHGLILAKDRVPGKWTLSPEGEEWEDHVTFKVDNTPAFQPIRFNMVSKYHIFEGETLSIRSSAAEVFERLALSGDNYVDHLELAKELSITPVELYFRIANLSEDLGNGTIYLQTNPGTGYGETLGISGETRQTRITNVQIEASQTPLVLEEMKVDYSWLITEPIPQAAIDGR